MAGLIGELCGNTCLCMSPECAQCNPQAQAREACFCFSPECPQCCARAALQRAAGAASQRAGWNPHLQTRISGKGEACFCFSLECPQCCAGAAFQRDGCNGAAGAASQSAGCNPHSQTRISGKGKPLTTDQTELVAGILEGLGNMLEFGNILY